MTKLYHAAGTWQIPGQQDKKAERVDVPNPPAELAAWLNSRRVPIEGDAFDGLVPGNAAARELLDALRDPVGLASEPPTSSDEHKEARRMAMGRCPRCNSTPRGAHLLLKGEEKDAILAWIEDADELWQIEAIALAVRDRVRALGLASEEQGRVQ